MDRDLYGVLGVPVTASQVEIRHAFRVLAKRRHPDVNRDDPDAVREFIEVRAAADILLDPRRRAMYDARLRLVTMAPPGTPLVPRQRPQATTPQTPAPKTPGPYTAPWQAAPNAPAAPTAAPVAAPGIPALSFIGGIILVACVISAVITLFANPPRLHSTASDGANGTVMWKATGFQLSDGWGINLPGRGTRLQVFPGTRTDLEVDSGYLSSAGRIAFLPQGAAPTYQRCLSAIQQTSDQAESLDGITPGTRSDLCSSGSSGDVAFVRVIRNDASGIAADITVWKNI